MSALSSFANRISAIMALVSALCALALFAGCASAAPEEDAEEVSLYPVAVHVEAPGWDALTSTPVIARVTGSDGEVFACALDANADETVYLSDGTYSISLVSPVNADGSIYSVPDPVELVVVSPAEGGEDSPERPVAEARVSLTLMASDEVGPNEITALLDEMSSAVAVGDESLSGEAGRAVIAMAVENAKAAAGVSPDEVDEAIAKAEEAVSGAEPSNAPSGSSQKAPSTGTSASGPAASSPAVPSGGGSSSSGGGSAPAHSHSWAASTEQRWVVDQAAWDEPIYEWLTVCTDCGEAQPSRDHLYGHLVNGGTGGTGSKSVQTGTVHHDEVGHYETVTVGYSCSCGATK